MSRWTRWIGGVCSPRMSAIVWGNDCFSGRRCDAIVTCYSCARIIVKGLSITSPSLTITLTSIRIFNSFPKVTKRLRIVPVSARGSRKSRSKLDEAEGVIDAENGVTVLETGFCDQRVNNAAHGNDQGVESLLLTIKSSSLHSATSFLFSTHIICKPARRHRPHKRKQNHLHLPGAFFGVKRTTRATVISTRKKFFSDPQPPTITRRRW